MNYSGTGELVKCLIVVFTDTSGLTYSDILLHSNAKSHPDKQVFPRQEFHMFFNILQPPFIINH